MAVSKQITLDTLISAWQSANAEQRKTALNALHNDAPAKGIGEPSIIRWVDLAKRLSVTKRTARTACERAKIDPVKLPGRQRAIGIRTADLWRLEGSAQ